MAASSGGSGVIESAGAAKAPTGLASIPGDFDRFFDNPSLENAISTFGPMLIELGQAVIALILLLIAVSFVSRWLQRLVTSGLRRAKIDPTVSLFLSRTAKYAVWLVAIPIAFELFGVRTTSLAAVIGAAGLAIGLAMQGSLSNIAAGVMLLLLRPMRVGDVVEIDSETGEVAELGIFYTTIKSTDNRMVFLPNSSVLGNKIENITGNDTRRVEVSVGVAYGTDLERARAVMLEAATQRVPARSRHETPQVWLTGFGASSIDFVVHVWCPSRELLVVRDQAIVAINSALQKSGIEIPFPQQTVRIARLPAPAHA